LIALRTFDEKPCVPAFPPKLFGYSLKRHIRPLFLQSQVTPGPARTPAACVSLSLSTMSISSRGHNPPKHKPTGAKTSRIPLSGYPADPASLSAFGTKGPQHHSAAPPQ
jgi:hypothetical protein